MSKTEITLVIGCYLISIGSIYFVAEIVQSARTLFVIFGWTILGFLIVLDILVTTIMYQTSTFFRCKFFSILSPKNCAEYRH